MNQNPPQNPEQVQKLMWFVFLSSISIFYFVGNFMKGPQTNSEIPQTYLANDGEELIKYVFFGLACLIAIISYFFRKRALVVSYDQNMDEDKQQQIILSLSVITWVMSEAVGVLGFVICFIYNDQVLGNSLITAGLIMLGFYRPISGSNNTLRKSYKNENMQ